MTKLFPVQLWWSVAAIATAYAAYFAKGRLDRASNRRRLAKAHGCQPAKEYKRSSYLFGLDCIGFKDLQLPDIWAMIHDRCLEYNNTFHLSILGAHMLETNEPENVKVILATQFKDFTLSWRQKAMTSFLGQGIFVTDGEQWRHSRNLLRPQFTREHVDDLPTFERHVGRLLAKLPNDGSTVDMEGFFFKLTLDATTEFLFGRSTNSLASDQSKDDILFADAVNEALDGTGNPFRHEGSLFMALLPDRKWNRAVKHVRSTIDELVQQARERHRSSTSEANVSKSGSSNDKDKDNKDEKYSVLAALAANSDAAPILIRDDLLNLLLAGRDTTATLLTNTLCVLLKPENAPILQRLRASLAHLEPSTPPTYAQIKSLTYLRHTLSEILRLMPPVPSNARVAAADVVLPTGGGPDADKPILVTKNTFVIWHIYSTHRRPDLWGKDAADFNPDRWEDARPGWAFVPFNGGPRVCLGQQFALTQASYVLVRLLQYFPSIESHDPEPWTPRLASTLLSRHGAKVGFGRPGVEDEHEHGMPEEVEQ